MLETIIEGGMVACVILGFVFERKLVVLENTLAATFKNFLIRIKKALKRKPTH